MDKRADIKVTFAPGAQTPSNSPLVNAPPARTPSNGSATQITPQNKCGFCTNSKCCTYITQHIDTPRSKYDFEHLLWQVSHENIGVYKDEDGWCLLVETRCGHLEPDGRCGIYADRPQICRDHSNAYCEFDAPAEDGFDLYFPDYSSLVKYCKKRFKRWMRG